MPCSMMRSMIMVRRRGLKDIGNSKTVSSLVGFMLGPFKLTWNPRMGPIETHVLLAGKP